MKGRIIVECVPNVVPNGMKQCGVCDKILPITSFHKGEGVCKDCYRERAKLRAEKFKLEHPEEYEAQRLRRNETKRAYYRRKTDLGSVAKAWRHPWEKI